MVGSSFNMPFDLLTAESVGRFQRVRDNTRGRWKPKTVTDLRARVSEILNLKSRMGLLSFSPIVYGTSKMPRFSAKDALP
jgi:hypothetical protein